jgi:hypothetical protein
MSETATLFSIIDNVAEKSSFNVPIMPDFLTWDDVPHYYLHSIYLEAMRCVSCGMYTAGIMIFGQLYEATLREIIKIKTNEQFPKATFGRLINIAQQKSLIDYEDVFFLRKINDNIRNVYVHQKFELIFSRSLLPTFKIDVSGKNMVEKIQTGIEDVKAGKVEPVMVDLTKDTILAAVTKEPIDHRNAIFFAWITNIKIEQLVKIYLNQKAYNAHISKFGSPYS